MRMTLDLRILEWPQLEKLNWPQRQQGQGPPGPGQEQHIPVVPEEDNQTVAETARHQVTLAGHEPGSYRMDSGQNWDKLYS